jgi:hypothetical protein
MYAVNPGCVKNETDVALDDVSKYCLFFLDSRLAEASNGSAITVNKNWPTA